MRRSSKAISIIFGSLAVLLLVIWGATFLIDEPLRRYLQEQINRSLEGYTVSIAELDLNPLNLGLILEGFTLRQKANPDQPVVEIREGTFKIHWRALLHGRVVAELEIKRPRVYINRNQLLAETKDEDEGPGWDWRIDELQVSGEAGFINRSQNPTYRIFISEATLNASNLSDRLGHVQAEARLEGQFMGSGATRVTAEFSELNQQPDFTLTAKVVGTRLQAMNELLLAYADLDVAEGTFTLYSSLRVQNGRIEGFVKPFITDVDIYTAQQEQGESLLDKVYEGFADVMANLLENEPRSIATKTEISGTLDDPDLNTWQILVHVVQNVFFQAVVPGFETTFEG